MSKVKDRIVHFVDDWTHAEALARTGFWGAYGGAGSIFLARNSGRLLLVRRSHHTLQPGTWGTIGGAVDRGEKPEETVVREVREELGIHVNPADLRLCYVFRDQKSHFMYYNYTVMIDEEFIPVPNWEVSEHAWVEFGQWPDPLHFGMEAWLQDPHGESTLRALVQQIANESAVRHDRSQ
jgi:8-oxo-dGTP pyrophosphatase MutT (NUDIX family)